MRSVNFSMECAQKLKIVSKFEALKLLHLGIAWSSLEPCLSELVDLNFSVIVCSSRSPLRQF